MSLCSAPILLLIYNRPELTSQVFEQIRKQKPRFLYIAADGPKDDCGDKDLCERTREIATKIEWDCEVKVLFRKTNLGCKYAVSSGITWFFEHVEAGIIIEDDCLPNSSFFLYCSELLKRYNTDNKVMHISGANLNNDKKFGDGTYYFSNYANIWGWATWRRAWEKYDLELLDVSFYSNLIKSTFPSLSEQKYWQSRIDLLITDRLDTWDYQWLFSIWKEKGVCLSPNYNLVNNIGFGKDSTHTKGASPYTDPETKNIVKIDHPSSNRIITAAELEFIRRAYNLQREGIKKYFFNKYFTQRCLNLVHKIKLKHLELFPGTDLKK